MLKPIIAIAGAGLLAAACTSTGHTERSALGGAALGALAGTAIGAVSGDVGVGTGAAVGAAVAAIATVPRANHVARIAFMQILLVRRSQ